MTFLWSKKYANFSTIVKWHFYRGIFDPNHGLTPLEICPIFNYSKMTFLSFKKPPIEKTTLWNDNTKISCTENNARGIFGTFKQNHGLTPLKKMWKIFDYSKMTFLSSKKHPFEKITSPNDKTKVFFLQKSNTDTLKKY